MRNFLLLLHLTLFTIGNANAQTGVIRTDIIKKIDDPIAESIGLFDDLSYNTSNLETTMNRLDTALSMSTLLHPYINDLEKSAVIIVKHSNKPVTHVEDTLKAIPYILHKENGQLSSYLLNTKKILVVILGGEKTLQKATIKIEKEKKHFATSFQELITLATNVGAMGTEVTIRIIELEPSKIVPPCNIKFAYPDTSKNYSIKVHEKSHFGFQAGIAASNLNKNNVKIESGDLVVTPDSTEQTEWKSNLIAMLVWSPWGQDVDRMGPIWKKIKEHSLGYHFAQRLGIFGGVKISKDPIQALYLGMNIAISKEFYVNFGWAWINQVQPSVTEVGAISSIQDALAYAKRKYEREAFIGVSFSPGQMLKMLKND